MKELKEIFAPHSEIKLGEQIVKVSPFIVKDIPVVVSIITKGFNEIFKPGATDIQTTQNMLNFLLKNLDEAYKLIEMTTQLNKDYFQDKSIETLSFVISEVIEVNYDFLYQKVMLQTGPLREKMMKNMGGHIPSKN